MFDRLSVALDKAETWVKSAATQKIVAQYGAELSDEIEAVYNGDEDQDEFEKKVKELLAALALAIYLAGTGKTKGELDDEDQAAIDEWVADQSQYVPGFAEAVVGAEDEAGKAEIGTRAGYWVNALSVFGAVAAGNTAAGGQRIGQWRYGATEQHCSTCADLAGGDPHPISWYLNNGFIPREAGSATLECGGWKCDCGVFDVITGEQLL